MATFIVLWFVCCLEKSKLSSEVCSIYLALLSITYNAEKWEIEDWKPTIKYYDFFAQSTNEARVKQVFPFVKVVSFNRCFIC